MSDSQAPNGPMRLPTPCSPPPVDENAGILAVVGQQREQHHQRDDADGQHRAFAQAA